MPLDVNSNFTSQSATILFDNIEVGYLQNLTINETYNVVEVDGIGSSNTIDFIPGVFKGRINAQRGILETNFIFDKMKPMVDDKTVISSLLSSVPVSDSVLSTLNFADQVLDNVNNLKNFLNPNSMKKLINILMFDIVLKDNNGIPYVTASDCILDSRNLTIDIGNVVIMNNITLKFKKSIYSAVGV